MVAAATETARYRSEWRSTGVGPRYSGWAHLAFTSLSCWAGIAFAISRIRHPSWAELATFPLGFLIANAAEYFGHRGPMHRPRWPLEAIFRRHAVEHHQFFTHREMSYETSRDFKMVLFPPVMILFFMGGMATPIAQGGQSASSASLGPSQPGADEPLELQYHLPHLRPHLRHYPPGKADRLK